MYIIGTITKIPFLVGGNFHFWVDPLCNWALQNFEASQNPLKVAPTSSLLCCSCENKPWPTTSPFFICFIDRLGWLVDNCAGRKFYLQFWVFCWFVLGGLQGFTWVYRLRFQSYTRQWDFTGYFFSLYWTVLCPYFHMSCLHTCSVRSNCLGRVF